MTLLLQLLAGALVKSGRLVVWFYYSPVRIVGRHHIPQRGPVLLVANHANSLMDPVLVGLTAKRRVSFLAKAPLFHVPLFGKIMTWIGMIPVHRPQDAPALTRHSLVSLAMAAESLAAGAAVGIFPEGKTHDLRALSEVLGGTARMIQQALDAGATGLQVVPVGINYDDKRLFRSAVWIEVGKPLDVAALLADAGTGAAARHVLTKEIAARLREVIIHLDTPALEPFLEDLEILDPALHAAGRQKIFSLQQRKSVADALNYFAKVRPEKVASIGRALVVHRAHLKVHGLRVGADLLNASGPRRLPARVWRSVRLGFGLIPVFCGIVQNAPPLAIERLIVRCLPQAGATTIALSRLAVAMPVFLLWYGLTGWLLAGYFLPWLAAAWLLTTPLAGLFALRYCQTLAAVSRDWWLELRMLFKRDELKSLRATQDKLRGRMSTLSDEYAALRPPLPVKPPGLHERPAFRFSILTGLIVAFVFLFVICSLRVGFRRNPLDALLRPAPDFSAMDGPTLERLITTDEQRLGHALDGMAALAESIRVLQAGIESGKLSLFNDADNDQISRQMLTYLNCRQELLELILRYRAPRSISDARLRLRASLMDLAAGCAIYGYASRFAALYQNEPEARRKLNEGEPAWGVPAGLYDTISANLKNERNLAPLRLALADYQAAGASYDAARLRESEPQAAFHRLIQQTTVAPPVESGWLGKVLQEADKLRAHTLYQGQSAVSRAVGSTRVRQRREGPRVRPAQLEEIRSMVRPGDILIERQDWFLSRAFMPGYWAHAALYIGTPQEVEALGLATHEWVAPHWEEFKRRGADGHLYAIIEAVPEGVRFTTLEHCLGVADSAAVLRPSLTTIDERKDAVARAFHHLGKAYDFEFDFFSADKLVCTELVARAYANAAHLKFPLVTVMGRQTLPPTAMVRKYCAERHTPEHQLELVIFLDGHAHGKQAVEGDAAALATTLERPGMTWFSSLE
jgi:glycerol-3-phosphate O-acyltransferase/dihydroxyacetone phosphate acyltransferase